MSRRQIIKVILILIICSKGIGANPENNSNLILVPTNNSLYDGLIVGDDSAAQALKKGDYTKAIFIYQQILIQNPNDKSAIIGLEHAEILQKNYTYAKQQLMVYKNKFGEDEQYLIEKARLFALTNQPQDALDLIASLLQKNPTNKLLLTMQHDVLTYSKGLLTNTRNPEFSEISQQDIEAGNFLIKGDYKQALSLFQQAYILDPLDKSALRGMIQGALFLENFAEAGKDLAIYKNKFGKDTHYLIEQARFFAFRRNREQALSILIPLLKQDPTNKSLLEIQDYAMRVTKVNSNANKSSSKRSTSIPSPAELAHLAELKHTDAPLYISAAKAYMSINNNKKALIMIDKALRIDPTNSNYLELKAKITDEKTAYFIYKRIYAANPYQPRILLELARKAGNLDKLDESALFYGIYTRQYPQDKKAWLEYAYIESWIGNDRKSVWILNHYQKLFGISIDYLIERARVLASAARPTEALTIINKLMPTQQNNYNLYYAKTTALYYHNQPIEMFENLKKVNELEPGTKETQGLNDFIRTPYRSSISLEAYHSFDTDTVDTTRFPLMGRYFLSPATSLLANFTPERLSATTASGLNPINGGTFLDLYTYNIGVNHRFDPQLGAVGWIGYTDPTEGKKSWVYEADTLFTINDLTNLNVQFKRNYYDVSARAVSLGVLQNLNQVVLLVTPCLQCYININTSYSTFSDSNTMTYTNIDIGRTIVTTELFNIKLGVSDQWQHFSKQLTDGYYDPERYRFYNINANVYYKYNDNIGYEFNIGIGRQRDETFTQYKPANDYAIRAYYGIYKDWYLILSAAQSTRGRAIADNVTNSTYVVTAFDAMLTRRF